MSWYTLGFKVELDIGNNAKVIDKERWVSRVFVTLRMATYCGELTSIMRSNTCAYHT
jgi:hypothetical protein